MEKRPFACVKAWTAEILSLTAKHLFTLWFPVVACGLLFYWSAQATPLVLKVVPFLFQPWIMLSAFVTIGVTQKFPSLDVTKTYFSIVRQTRVFVSFIFLGVFYAGLAAMAYSILDRPWGDLVGRDWPLLVAFTFIVLLYQGTALGSLFVAEEERGFVGGLVESFKFVYKNLFYLGLTALGATARILVVFAIVAAFLAFIRWFSGEEGIIDVMLPAAFYYVVHTALFFQVYVIYQATRREFSVMFQESLRIASTTA